MQIRKTSKEMVCPDCIRTTSLQGVKDLAAEGSTSSAGPSAVPAYRLPKIVTNAHRRSTRLLLREVLVLLDRQPTRSAKLNVSQLARTTGFHRRTVQRSLDFGVAAGVLALVIPMVKLADRPYRHAGAPRTYRSLWKLTSSKRAPLLRPHKVQDYLSCGKTRTRVSTTLKTSSIARIRTIMEAKKLPHLVAAFGRYIWSPGATAKGILSLAGNPTRFVNDRTPTLDRHNSFGLTMDLILAHIRPFDAAVNAIADLKSGIPYERMPCQEEKPAPANIGNYKIYQYLLARREGERTPQNNLDSSPRSTVRTTDVDIDTLTPQNNYLTPGGDHMHRKTIRPRGRDLFMEDGFALVKKAILDAKEHPDNDNPDDRTMTLRRARTRLRRNGPGRAYRPNGRRSHLHTARRDHDSDAGTDNQSGERESRHPSSPAD